MSNTTAVRTGTSPYVADVWRAGEQGTVAIVRPPSQGATVYIGLGTLILIIILVLLLT